MMIELETGKCMTEQCLPVLKEIRFSAEGGCAIQSSPHSSALLHLTAISSHPFDPSSLLHTSVPCTYTYAVAQLLTRTKLKVIAEIMEALLSSARVSCPFLKKSSPATLRSLSTATARHTSPGGGSMSNLQVIARRCPIMSKALAVQSSRNGSSALAGVFGGTRGYKSKAGLHTTRVNAATVDTQIPRQRNEGL
jgi:hypothetical protein